MAEFQDRVLQCVDCGADFTFASGEQQFYREKGFVHEPKRCKSCKNARQSGSPERGGPPRRIETPAVCSQCGRETTIPFKPTQGRPVFCRDCFKDQRAANAATG